MPRQRLGYNLTMDESDRIKQLVSWIVTHQRDIIAIQKGQLVFNIAGAEIRPVLTIHFEMPGGAHEQDTGGQSRIQR